MCISSASAAHRFRGLDRAEDVFQVVAAGLAGEFGPLAEAELEDMGARRDSAHVPPFPSSLVGRVTPAWVGRDHELDVLRSAWREAAVGTFRTVLVAGEPGAGKTALAAQFASEVAQDGGWVLHGHSDEDAVVPYRAFAETLEQLVGAAGGSLLAEHTTDHGGDLCAIVPLLGPAGSWAATDALDHPEADRVRIAAAVSGLLEAGSRQRPILLVFDDLHWADAATVGLVRDLVQRSAAARLLLLATYRSTDVERQQPSAQLLADLRREPGVHACRPRRAEEHRGRPSSSAPLRASRSTITTRRSSSRSVRTPAAIRSSSSRSFGTSSRSAACQ